MLSMPYMKPHRNSRKSLFLAPSFPDVCIDQYHLIDVAGLVVQYPIMFATDQLSVGREHNRVARALRRTCRTYRPCATAVVGACTGWRIYLA